MEEGIYMFRKYKPSAELLRLIKMFRNGEIDEATFKKNAIETEQSLSIAKELRDEGVWGHYFVLTPNKDGYILEVAFVR